MNRWQAEMRMRTTGQQLRLPSKLSPSDMHYSLEPALRASASQKQETLPSANGAA